MRYGRRGAFSLALLLLVAACSSGARPARAREYLTVFAAASLRAPLTALGHDFDLAHPRTTTTFSFAGSQSLVAQLQQGAPADVLATADLASFAAVAADTLGPPVVFARNQLAIVVPPGNPKHLTGLADLARPGLKVVLAGPTVPAGRAADRALAAARVTVHPVSLASDVTAVVGTVRLGEADAGLAYVSDVRTSGATVAGVPLPGVSNSYPAAALRRAHDPSLARAFVSFLLSARARQVLQADGFLPPP